MSRPGASPEDRYTEEQHQRLLEDPCEINPSEVFWIAHQPFLESCGYQLRPRYRPGWVKSWTRNPGFFVEEAVSPSMPSFKVMDATRKSDGRIVVLKRLKLYADQMELNISRYLSQQEFLSDERNHCAPLLDVLYPERSQDMFLVFPLLRYFDDPTMQSRDDVTEFIRQTLEGLVFMHEKGVAHRDCARFNTMMDPKDLYPKGYHPQRNFLTVDATTFAHERPRHKVRFPKYYFIDFGLSVRFRNGEPPIAWGTAGQDKSAPEFQPKEGSTEPAPYNAYLLDIYILGNLYKKELLANYQDLSFLTPLVDRMTAKNPSDRPSAAEALELLRSCQRRLLPLALYRPIFPVYQNPFTEIAREVWFWGQRATTIRQGTFEPLLRRH
ncbi:hypothetical protein BOTBODRAFT_65125 [Botryobasidium botryosum FD-172 SS1]|uniref:Protein kinase domain-containing protein n=1 Tax=Botryobasidium botryosum (strain FD-172 SS1) TaxID=930990 RepID=A0A067MWD2_BOTB1|nr:hypothetical protein BOTBODRAFT_65125 [Botryobasidium botryosum FD-172 SS1]